MSEFFIKAAQLILSLSLLIVLHELGHFLPAKWFKTRVDKFYLFFDPYFSLFKFKRGDTEYGIGWLPLGGYVKIAGMIDESDDKEFLNHPPQPWEFRSKPAWQRLIIMVGGVTVNVIVGIVIYAGIMFYYGETYLPIKNAKYGVMVDSVGLKMGLQQGDKILSVQHKPMETFGDVTKEILLNEANSIEVERDGQRVDLPINDDFHADIIRSPGFLRPRVPFTIYDFPANSAAKTAGIKIDDKVIAINGIKTTYFDEAQTQLQANKNKDVVITVLRGTQPTEVKMHISETGMMGVMPASYDMYFPLEVKQYTLLQSFPKGLEKAGATLENYIKQFKLIFSPKVKGYESLGGFASMGKIFSPTWDWEHFWNITAFFSVVLAIMNILPIPALDGGHVIFLIYEMITRRKPNEKFMEYAQYAGLFLLLGITLFANGNDLYRFITDKF